MDNLTICVEAIDGLAIRRDQLNGLELVGSPPEIRVSYQEFWRLFAGQEVNSSCSGNHEHLTLPLSAERVVIRACRRINDDPPTKRVLE